MFSYQPNICFIRSDWTQNKYVSDLFNRNRVAISNKSVEPASKKTKIWCNLTVILLFSRCKYFCDSQVSTPFILVGNKFLPTEYAACPWLDPAMLRVWACHVGICFQRKKLSDWYGNFVKKRFQPFSDRL